MIPNIVIIIYQDFGINLLLFCLLFYTIFLINKSLHIYKEICQIDFYSTYTNIRKKILFT
jgi:hypothetical protein